MAHEPQLSPAQLVAERKRRLLADGAVYRVGIVRSKQVVLNNLSADALLHAGLDQLTKLITPMGGPGLGGLLGAKGIKLQTLAPLVLSGISFLAKKGWLKPALYGSVAIGAAAYVTVWVRRRKAR